jgi:carboxylesterase type B
MRLPAIRLADAHADKIGRTYMYEFAWPAPGLGAVHALEIPFVFDSVGPDVPLFGPMLGSDAPQELADTMHGAWVAFAAGGDPGPDWPRYDLDRRATMRFDVSSKAVPDPSAWEREVWAGIR